jgi:acetyl esterase/lipase
MNSADNHCSSALVRRRSVLGALAGTVAAGALVACGAHRTAKAGPMSASPTADRAPTRHRYGTDASQWADLYQPDGPSRGRVVVIHGGFWLSQYGAELGAPLAADLAARGWTALNLEYRRIGNGGGWPNTFTDVAAGIDLLAALPFAAAPSSTGSTPIRSTTTGSTTTGRSNKIIALGHSAGGQLATWAAARRQLPAGAPGAAPRVELTGVISQAGVLDLASAFAHGVGGAAVSNLLGGSPSQVPERYRQCDPQQQIPVAVPVHCVHATGDQNVPYSQSANYVAAARAKGAVAELHRVDGDHFSLIDINSTAWQTIVSVLATLTG